MGLKLNIWAIFLFILLASTANIAQSGDFDVTSVTYGGKPDTDITQALGKAWTDACASPGGKVVVPKGTYMLKGATFNGPCKGPIEIQIQGTLKAPEDGNQISKPDTWVAFEYIDLLTLSGGGTFDGQGKLAWSQNDCHKNTNCKSIINLRFHSVTNSKIQDITTKDSKNFHVNLLGCSNVTFQYFTVSAPGDSINTDGIHIGRSTRINIIDTNIATGDDCISIGEGNKQITVTNVTCGPGHGISIGSLGRYPKEGSVEGVFVKNCTISDTENGIRIKTWPASPDASTASDMHFEDIVVNNVKFPILIDQQYCPYNQCKQNVPSKVKISNVSFKKIRGTSSDPLAVKLVCSNGLPCDKVELADIDIKYIGNKGPITSQCSNVKPTISSVPQALACATSV